MSRKSNRLKNRLRIEQERSARAWQQLDTNNRAHDAAVKTLRGDIEHLRKSHIVLSIEQMPTMPMAVASVTARMWDANDRQQLARCDQVIDPRAVEMAKNPPGLAEQIGHEIAVRLMRFGDEHGLRFKPR